MAGNIDWFDCPKCKGLGTLREEQTLRFGSDGKIVYESFDHYCSNCRFEEFKVTYNEMEDNYADK